MKTKRFFSFSDVHVPHQDNEAVNWVISAIEEHQPDVLVFNGDMFEADAASRWDSEDEHTLIEEYRVGGEILKAARQAAPDKCECVFIEGNHDANIIAPHRINKKLRELIDYREHVRELEFWKQFKYVNNPRHCVYRLGQVGFMHGFMATKTSGNMEGIMPYVDEWGLTVRGHTHRPEPVTRCKYGQRPLNMWYANTGTLVGLDPCPAYVSRASTQEWGQAYIKGEVALLKSPRRSRMWDAEVVIRKLAWDEGTPWKSGLKGVA